MTRSLSVLILLLVGAAFILGAQSPGSSLGDGGAAIAAQLAYPQGVAVDTAGNLYIADTANHRVRKVTRDGVIRTVAGIGTSALIRDGVPAIQAGLSNPGGIAVDAQGNFYITDNSNRVYKITSDGILHVFAGNGRRAFNGDGGPATEASFDVLQGLTVDADGNVYIVDVYNHRVRKVDTAGIISTVAGSGPNGGISRVMSGDGGPALEAKFANPSHVAIDSMGNLFVADYSGRLRAVRRGTITTIAGDGSDRLLVASNGDGGPATNVPIFSPLGIVVDKLGNVYFSSGNRIRKIDPKGILSTIVGSGAAGVSGDGGPAISAQLNRPRGIALDAEGNLYIADADNCRVRKVSPNGIISTVAGSTLAPRQGAVLGGIIARD
jgi:sugar lactone lactonase YvrE